MIAFSGDLLPRFALALGFAGCCKVLIVIGEAFACSQHLIEDFTCFAAGSAFEDQERIEEVILGEIAENAYRGALALVDLLRPLVEILDMLIQFREDKGGTSG